MRKPKEIDLPEFDTVREFEPIPWTPALKRQLKIAVAVLVVGLLVLGWFAWREFKPIGPPKPTEEYSGAKEVPYR